MTDNISVRKMTSTDAEIICAAFRAQGWNKPQTQFQDYCRQQDKGKRTALVAELNGKFAGYVTILWESHYLPFREAGIPEIADFNVLPKHQRRGVGTALMDHAEDVVLKRSEIAGIAVGLYADYGAAQIMYAKRGYLPDGRGMQYNGAQVKFGDKITVDHNLVMNFTKRI